MSRKLLTLAAAASLVAATFAMVGAAQPAAAAKGKKKPRARIVSVMTPLGLQGDLGAGSNVGIAFVAANAAGNPVEVEMQFGRDLNSDGAITDDEFRPATEDRLDPRDTRSNRPPPLFPATQGEGTSNVIVWQSGQDIGVERFPLVEYLLSVHGRFIPDPSAPGAFLLANGPGGSPILSGVAIRLRTVTRRPGKGKKPRFTFSPWVASEAFALDNTTKPTMKIDSVTAGTPVLVGWRAFSADTEDLDGDGRLGIGQGEDMDGDGRLDGDRMGVAFDWHRLAPGEVPTAMSDAQLEALSWSPCTRLFGAGDTDSLDARPGVPVPASGDFAGVASAHPTRAGQPLTFAWDAARDAGAAADSFILRATPFCEHRSVGKTVYSRTITNLGD